eukprot:70206-Prymnesium_polylepis.1
MVEPEGFRTLPEAEVGEGSFLRVALPLVIALCAVLWGVFVYFVDKRSPMKAEAQQEVLRRLRFDDGCRCGGI